MATRVKICGITRMEDAAAAVEAGADALGFMFYSPSPRNVSCESAADMIKRLPPFVVKVGVFVNAMEDSIRQAIEVAGINVVQLHGNESPEFCGRFGNIGVIKAFRVQDEASLKPLTDYRVSAWLLDGYVPGVEGGTGQVFNWDLAVQAKRLSTPIVLAGGLTFENIRQAIQHVRPYGVDVSSGVESSKGIKDARLIRSFIEAAHSVD